MSLLAIRHLAYDFVFAAPVAALAFGLPRLSQACVMASLAYLWFGLKLLTSMDITGKWVELLSFLALSLMLAHCPFCAAPDPGSARRVGRGDGWLA